MSTLVTLVSFFWKYDYWDPGLDTAKSRAIFERAGALFVRHAQLAKTPDLYLAPSGCSFSRIRHLVADFTSGKIFEERDPTLS